MRTQLEQKYGADNTIYDVNERPRLDFSRFDFSRKNNTTFDIGQVIPIDWFRVFPGDKIDLTNRYIIDTFPLVNTPFTNYRVRIQWYAIELSGLHKGWQSFISQGRKGQVSIKQLPVLKEQDRVGLSPHVFLPSSLASQLSLPVLEASKKAGFDYVDPYVVDEDGSLGIERIPNRHLPVNGVNLMPFLFYQKIFRHGIVPQNLLQENEVWYPEDLSEEWRFDYNASNVSSSGYFVPSGSLPEEDSIIAHPVPSVEDNCVDLLSLRYACFDRDYFTEAKPWLVRGDVQGSADLNVSDFVGGLDISSIIEDPTLRTYVSGSNTSSAVSLGTTNLTDPDNGDSTPALVYNGANLPSTSERPAYISSLANLYSRISFAKSSSAKASLTANSLRTMIAYSVWQERNALTNGNYNGFIKAHFNENPRKPDYEPVYLGGMSNMMNFGQVIQTSESSSSGTPLGTQAGLGSSTGSQQLFHFESKNFGYLMGVLYVTPEVYYTQGVGHEWTDILPEDWFMPEFSRTGFEPILNQEIFPQNNAHDLELFGYQTRECFLKARQNRASGMFAVPAEYDLLFSTYVQAREFASLPLLSLQFVSCSPENLRRDFLAYTKYPAFKLQIASDVKLIRALPYASTPETFGF